MYILLNSAFVNEVIGVFPCYNKRILLNFYVHCLCEWIFCWVHSLCSTPYPCTQIIWTLVTFFGTHTVNTTYDKFSCLTAMEKCNSFYCYHRMSSGSGFEPKYTWCWLQGGNPLTVSICSQRPSCQTEMVTTASVQRSIMGNLLKGNLLRYLSGNCVCLLLTLYAMN